MVTPKPNITPTVATTLPLGDKLLVTVTTTGQTQWIRILAPKGVADLTVEQWTELKSWMATLIQDGGDAEN